MPAPLPDSASPLPNAAAASPVNPGLRHTSAADRWLLRVLLLVAVLFGANVLNRSAFLNNRRTDAGVFFRAGWAIRVGADPYTVTDNNGWHYLYPPLFAALVAPLADPPDGAPRDGCLPYPVSIVIWYVLSVLSLWVGAHWLARAIEESSPLFGGRGPPVASRWWWGARVLPILICATAAGSTLSRGQVNIFLTMMIAGMALSLVRGRAFLAGVWLAAATVLKVFPALLVIYPMLRRDWRCLAGFATGLVMGLAVLPAILLGPGDALRHSLVWAERIMLPAFGLADPGPLLGEIHGMTSTDNQSFKAVIHHWQHVGTPRASMPKEPDTLVRLAHFGLGGVFTLAVVLAAGLHPWVGAPRRSDPREAPLRTGDTGRQTVLILGLLTCVTLMASPVVHLHYYVLAMPLVSALVIHAMHRSPTGELPPWVWACLAIYIIGNTLPRLPGFEATRYWGMAPAMNIALFIVGAVALMRSRLVPGRAA